MLQFIAYDSEILMEGFTQALEDVLPREISLFKREPRIPGLSNSVSITEEFLAHVSLCGENPEITHYTLPTPSNVVPPVVL
jgi:hypothetical protein